MLVRIQNDVYNPFIALFDNDCQTQPGLIYIYLNWIIGRAKIAVDKSYSDIT